MEFADSPSPFRTYIELHGWHIEYAAIDAGPGAAPRRKAVIAFHGFARPLEDHLIWQSLWPEPVKLISVHLPHHGGSRPLSENGKPMDAALRPEEFIEMLCEIAEREGCDSTEMDLIGYSIGGRIAFSLLVTEEARWGRAILMAPDGLKKAPFYNLTVHTQLGRWLWKKLDRHADAANALVVNLHRWGLLPKHLKDFALFHTHTSAMREMVWNGWRTHRLFWPSRKALIRTLSQRNHGRIDCFFGTNDRIIPAQNAEWLKRRISGISTQRLRFHTLASGHGMLRQEVLNQAVARIFET